MSAAAWHIFTAKEKKKKRHNLGCYCGHWGRCQTSAVYLLSSGETTLCFSLSQQETQPGEREQHAPAEPRPCDGCPSGPRQVWLCLNWRALAAILSPNTSLSYIGYCTIQLYKSSWTHCAAHIRRIPQLTWCGEVPLMLLAKRRNCKKKMSHILLQHANKKKKLQNSSSCFLTDVSKTIICGQYWVRILVCEKTRLKLQCKNNWLSGGHLRWTK